MKAFLQARKTILSLVGVVLLVLLMMNLNSRLADYLRLASERDKLGTQVMNLEATRANMQTQVAYATSDQAVEDWARNDAHMAKPGDFVIVQVTPVNQTPVPRVESTPAPRVVDNWEVWWALFFGE